MRYLTLLSVILMLGNLPAIAATTDKDNRIIIGRIENVGLDDAHMVAKARIDTGAGLTSLNAENIQISKLSNGKESVTFDLIDENGKKVTMKRTIIEYVNIKTKKSGYDKRPVIRMDFCIAGKKIEARTNLANRAHFLYPALIGRNILKTGNFLIDPKRKFMTKPEC